VTRSHPVPWLLIGLLSFAGFAALVPGLYGSPRLPASGEMEVAVPRFAQVLTAAGDRYLAADLSTFRALVASTERMERENYRILGIVQSDVAWLNPAHEDNYYIAAAILPWNGELEAAQHVLQQASKARPFDWQPAFYYAFNTWHFSKNAREGAEWMKIAADQALDEGVRIQLLQLAAQWAGNTQDRAFAIRLHKAMARETRHRGFAVFLEKRATRLENLLRIEEAVARYEERTGRTPLDMADLVALRLLAEVPSDPFAMQYVIGRDGKPEVVHPGGPAQARNSR